MEVRIRLQKSGKLANRTFNYRIVAVGRNKSRQGRSLDILGYYDSAKKPAVISVDFTKLDKWVSQGAQMTDTVRSLVNRVKKTK